MILLFLAAAVAQGEAPAADYVESATEVRISIGIDGKAKDCMVTRSSGAPVLDEKVCPNMLAKAQFKPKTDEAGKPVESSFTTAIKWRLPREGAAQP